jgi:nickel-dependent lactate racemase
MVSGMITQYGLRSALPPDCALTTLEPHFAAPIDLQREVGAALAAPLQSGRLSELAPAHARVCIVFTDATRACPDHMLVPAILRELAAAGVRDGDITLLCATGLHRASTREEKIAKLGQAVVDRYRVIDHDASQCVTLQLSRGGSHAAGYAGVGARSADISISPLLLDSDLIIATGVVEPHQYAGYSGGGKTVVIGCGGERTIEYTHGPQFLDHPGVRLGRIDGNPFQQFVRDAAEAIGLKFVVNVVLNGEGEAVAVRAGHPIAVHDALIKIARSGHEVPVDQMYDLIITKVDPPKDVNLYQASRAATYIGLSANPPLREGGVLIIEARCPEGAGQGVGERRFFEALAAAADLQQLLAEFRRNGCRAGEQRAFMLAQVLLKYHVIIAGSACPEVVTACKMMAVDSIAAGLDPHCAPLAGQWDKCRAREIIGTPTNVLYLPHPLQTVPSVIKRA